MKITIGTTIKASVDKTWNSFNSAEHIVHWNFASPDWHCPKASVDLTVGGKFCNTMASKDGSMAFDFEGSYTEIRPNEFLAFALGDGRIVTVSFREENGVTILEETFDAEDENTAEMQRQGWQNILNNFKSYTENL